MTASHLTLAEVKEILEEEAKKRELSYEQRMALQHASTFARLPAKKARKLVEELMQFERVSEFHACRIVDFMAQHPDEIRSIFAKERFDLTPEEIEKIIETVRKYL
jgi:DNA-directed RNA polymerase subunit F